MLGLAFSLITQPWTIIAVLVAVAGVVALGFLRGWPAVLKLLADGRTWMVAIAAILVIGSANLDRKVDALQEQVQTEQIEKDAYVDASEVLVERNVKQRVRAGETRRIQEALTQANPGEEVDAVMDAIAAEQERRRADGAGA